MLGRFGGSWGVFGGVLGTSWGILGALGALLGRLGAVLGGLEAVLGRLELLGSFLAQQGGLDTLTWARFGSPKGSQDDPKMRLKMDQNRCQK